MSFNDRFEQEQQRATRLTVAAWVVGVALVCSSMVALGYVVTRVLTNLGV